MRKLTALVVIGTFVFYAAAPLASIFAAEKPAAATSTTVTASGEAEKVAANASLIGVSQTVIEGVIFATALGLMAVTISSDSDSNPAQAHGHGHGH